MNTTGAEMSGRQSSNSHQRTLTPSGATVNNHMQPDTDISPLKNSNTPKICLSTNFNNSLVLSSKSDIKRRGTAKEDNDGLDGRQTTLFGKSILMTRVKTPSEAYHQDEMVNLHEEVSNDDRLVISPKHVIAIADENIMADSTSNHIDDGATGRIVDQEVEQPHQQQNLVEVINDLTQAIIQKQNRSHRLFKLGKNRKCLELVDQIVKMRVSVEGQASESLIDYITQVGRLFNQAAMELLSQDEPRQALQILQATQAFLAHVDEQNSKVCSLVSLTLNNLSSVFKRKGEIQEAQEFLAKELKKAKLAQSAIRQEVSQKMRKSEGTSEDEVEKQAQDNMVEENSALFHLNICANFHQQGCHEKAKTHASIAVKALERSVLLLKRQIDEADGTDLNSRVNAAADTSQQTPSAASDLRNQLKDRISLLAIAYYNLGCEFEHLNLLDECHEFYSKAQGLQMSRYGNQNLESQFARALQQVRLRLKDQDRSHSKLRAGHPRRASQPYRQHPKSKSVIGLQQNSSSKAESTKQQTQLGKSIEKTLEAILSLNRVDGAPKSFDSGSKKPNNQRPVSESNQARSGKMQLRSTALSDRGLQEIQEERNLNTSNIHTAAGPLVGISELLNESQRPTPVKSQIARTINKMKEGNTAMLAVDEPARRVVLSAKYQKRPQSAQYLPEDPFVNNTYKEQSKTNLTTAKVPLAISSSKQATKCLKKANWIKQWFKKAQVSVDTKVMLEQALIAKATENQNQSQSSSQVEVLNLQPLRTASSQPRFSSTHEQNSTNVEQIPQRALPMQSVYSSAGDAMSCPPASQINARPVHHVQRATQGAAAKRESTCPSEMKQLSKRAVSHSKFHPTNQGSSTVINNNQAWANKMIPQNDQIFFQKGMLDGNADVSEINDIKHREQNLRKKQAVAAVAKILKQKTPKVAATSQQKNMIFFHKAQPYLTATNERSPKRKSKSTVKRLRRCPSHNNRGEPIFPHLMQAQAEQKMMAQTATTNSGFGLSASSLKPYTVKAPFSSKERKYAISIEDSRNAPASLANGYIMLLPGKPPTMPYQKVPLGQLQLQKQSQSYQSLPNVQITKKQIAQSQKRVNRMQEKQFNTTHQNLINNINFYNAVGNSLECASPVQISASPTKSNKLFLPGNANPAAHTGGASRRQSEQRRGGGQGRHKQSSQAKMLKKMRQPLKQSHSQQQLNRQQVMDNFSMVNQRMMLYTGQIEAAERYTQGPIRQVVQPYDNEKQLLVTQTLNLKSKKPEVLKKQFIVADKKSFSAKKPPTVLGQMTNQAYQGSQARQKPQQTVTQFYPQSKWPSKPPSSISQPAIKITIPNASTPQPQAAVEAQQQSSNNKSLMAAEKSHSTPQKASKFTQVLKTKVNRQTQKIFAERSSPDVSQDQLQQQWQQEHFQAREDRVDTEEIHSENLRPRLISSEKQQPEEQEEVPVNNSTTTPEAKIEQFSTAVVMILAHIKEYQKGLEQEQENQEVQIQQQEPSMNQKTAADNDKTMELDDDYKDDDFDSVAGDDHKSKDDDQEIVLEGDGSIYANEPDATSVINQSIAMESEEYLQRQTPAKQPNAIVNNADESAIADEVASENGVPDEDKPFEEIEIEDDLIINNQSIHSAMAMSHQSDGASSTVRHIRDLIKESYNEAIQLQEKDEQAQKDKETAEKKTIIPVVQVASFLNLVDGATQTSKIEDSARLNKLQKEHVIQEEEIEIEEIMIAVEPQQPEDFQPVEEQKDDIVMETFLTVPFQKINENEVVIVEQRVLNQQAAIPMKLQVVSLPFVRDDGGVKIGFKGIRQDQPKFQNELIQIDLKLTRDELMSENKKVQQLIDQLMVDEATGNLSLPQDSLEEVALFTMQVRQEDFTEEQLLREVIAIYQNREEPADLSKGNVVLQTLTARKNQVTVPMKRHSRKVNINDLKANLLKHLPCIVFVDKQGNVALEANDDRERIGRVLPHGQGIQETNMIISQSDDNSSQQKLYDLELQQSNLSDTFVSQLDRARIQSIELKKISITHRSQDTRQGQQKSGALMSENAYDIQDGQIPILQKSQESIVSYNMITSEKQNIPEKTNVQITTNSVRSKNSTETMVHSQYQKEQKILLQRKPTNSISQLIQAQPSLAKKDSIVEQRHQTDETKIIAESQNHLTGRLNYDDSKDVVSSIHYNYLSSANCEEEQEKEAALSVVEIAQVPTHRQSKIQEGLLLVDINIQNNDLYLPSVRSHVKPANIASLQIPPRVSEFLQTERSQNNAIVQPFIEQDEDLIAVDRSEKDMPVIQQHQHMNIPLPTVTHEIYSCMGHLQKAKEEVQSSNKWQSLSQTEGVKFSAFNNVNDLRDLAADSMKSDQHHQMEEQSFRELLKQIEQQQKSERQIQKNMFSDKKVDNKKQNLSATRLVSNLDCGASDSGINEANYDATQESQKSDNQSRLNQQTEQKPVLLRSEKQHRSEQATVQQLAIQAFDDQSSVQLMQSQSKFELLNNQTISDKQSAAPEQTLEIVKMSARTLPRQYQDKQASGFAMRKDSEISSIQVPCFVDYLAQEVQIQKEQIIEYYEANSNNTIKADIHGSQIDEVFDEKNQSLQNNCFEASEHAKLLSLDKEEGCSSFQGINEREEIIQSSSSNQFDRAPLSHDPHLVTKIEVMSSNKKINAWVPDVQSDDIGAAISDAFYQVPQSSRVTPQTQQQPHGDVYHQNQPQQIKRKLSPLKRKDTLLTVKDGQLAAHTGPILNESREASSIKDLHHRSLDDQTVSEVKQIHQNQPQQIKRKLSPLKRKDTVLTVKDRQLAAHTGPILNESREASSIQDELQRSQDDQTVSEVKEILTHREQRSPTKLKIQQDDKSLIMNEASIVKAEVIKMNFPLPKSEENLAATRRDIRSPTKLQEQQNEQSTVSIENESIQVQLISQKQEDIVQLPTHRDIQISSPVRQDSVTSSLKQNGFVQELQNEILQVKPVLNHKDTELTFLDVPVAQDLDMSSLKDAIEVLLRDDSHQEIISEAHNSSQKVVDIFEQDTDRDTKIQTAFRQAADSSLSSLKELKQLQQYEEVPAVVLLQISTPGNKAAVATHRDQKTRTPICQESSEEDDSQQIQQEEQKVLAAPVVGKRRRDTEQLKTQLTLKDLKQATPFKVDSEVSSLNYVENPLELQLSAQSKQGCQEKAEEYTEQPTNRDIKQLAQFKVDSVTSSLKCDEYPLDKQSPVQKQSSDKAESIQKSTMRDKTQKTPFKIDQEVSSLDEMAIPFKICSNSSQGMRQLPEVSETQTQMQLKQLSPVKQQSFVSSLKQPKSKAKKVQEEQKMTLDLDQLLQIKQVSDPYNINHDSEAGKTFKAQNQVLDFLEDKSLQNSEHFNELPDVDLKSDNLQSPQKAVKAQRPRKIKLSRIVSSARPISVPSSDKILRIPQLDSQEGNFAQQNQMSDLTRVNKVEIVRAIEQDSRVSSLKDEMKFQHSQSNKSVKQSADFNEGEEVETHRNVIMDTKSLVEKQNQDASINLPSLPQPVKKLHEEQQFEHHLIEVDTLRSIKIDSDIIHGDLIVQPTSPEIVIQQKKEPSVITNVSKDASMTRREVLQAPIINLATVSESGLSDLVLPSAWKQQPSKNEDSDYQPAPTISDSSRTVKSNILQKHSLKNEQLAGSSSIDANQAHIDPSEQDVFLGDFGINLPASKDQAFKQKSIIISSANVDLPHHDEQEEQKEISNEPFGQVQNNFKYSQTNKETRVGDGLLMPQQSEQSSFVKTYLDDSTFNDVTGHEKQQETIEDINSKNDTPQKDIKLLLKIKPSLIKSVKTKFTGRPSARTEKNKPKTKRAKNYSNKLSESDQKSSSSYDNLYMMQQQVEQQQNCLQTTENLSKIYNDDDTQTHDLSTIRDRKVQPGIQQQDQTTVFTAKKSFSHHSKQQSTIPPQSTSEDAGIWVESVIAPTMSNSRDTDKILAKDNVDVISSLDDIEETRKQLTKQFDQKPKCISVVNDWRDGVQIKFEITGPNTSAIRLCQDGEVIDTKNVAFNFERISRNYDVASLDQFCKEWLIPCVSIKSTEWIVQGNIDDEKNFMPSLQLQVHGEMLSELIFKQFILFNPRPTSSITALNGNDEQNYAHMYSQELTNSQEDMQIASSPIPVKEAALDIVSQPSDNTNNQSRPV